MHSTLPAVVLSLGALFLGPVGSSEAAPQGESQITEPYALQGVRLALDKGAPAQTILVADGRIQKIQPLDGAIPPGYRVLEGDGLLALPAFIDAYSHAGTTLPEPVITQDIPVDTGSDVRIAMRSANRKGIQPHWSAVDGWTLDAKACEARLGLGFGALLSAPHGDILSGKSVISLMNSRPRREAVLVPESFAHAAFSARGSGYPTTLMGYHAQLRQFLMDAAWHADLRERREAGQSVPRAAFDRDLIEAHSLISAKKRLVCEAETSRDIHRWLALAEEFGLEIAIAGGREAWKVADELAARKIPVVLTLDWPAEVLDPSEAPKGGADSGGQEAAEEFEPSADADESEDAEAGNAASEVSWSYEEPLALRQERRRRWEALRDNAMVLHKAGVAVYFGTGSKGTKQLLERLRTLSDAGMDQEVLLQILTRQSAEWLGIGDFLGPVADGRSATFCVWTESPFAKGAKVRFAFVEGVLTEFEIKEPKNGSGDLADITGVWALDLGDQGPDAPVTLHLEMDKEGAISGFWKGDDTGNDQTITGAMEGATFEVSTTADMEGVQVTLTITGEIDGDSMSGVATSTNPALGLEIEFTGERQPKGGQ